MKYFSIIFIIFVIFVFFILNISKNGFTSEELEEENFFNDKNGYNWENDINNYDIHNKVVQKPTGNISQSYIKGVASIYAPDIYVK